MEPVLREVANASDMKAARSIRMAVFVREQNVPIDIEMDEYDKVAIHVLCLFDGVPIGTGRLVRMPEGMKLGRVAVLAEHRGKGFGKAIVQWLLGRAKESGADGLFANVQLTARKFYEDMGFVAQGPMFLEAGIEHVRMTKSL